MKKLIIGLCLAALLVGCSSASHEDVSQLPVVTTSCLLKDETKQYQIILTSQGDVISIIEMNLFTAWSAMDYTREQITAMAETNKKSIMAINKAYYATELGDDGFTENLIFSSLSSSTLSKIADLQVLSLPVSYQTLGYLKLEDMILVTKEGGFTCE